MQPLLSSLFVCRENAKQTATLLGAQEENKAEIVSKLTEGDVANEKRAKELGDKFGVAVEDIKTLTQSAVKSAAKEVAEKFAEQLKAEREGMVPVRLEDVLASEKKPASDPQGDEVSTMMSSVDISVEPEGGNEVTKEKQGMGLRPNWSRLAPVSKLWTKRGRD